MSKAPRVPLIIALMVLNEVTVTTACSMDIQSLLEDYTIVIPWKRWSVLSFKPLQRADIPPQQYSHMLRVGGVYSAL